MNIKPPLKNPDPGILALKQDDELFPAWAVIIAAIAIAVLMWIILKKDE